MDYVHQIIRAVFDLVEYDRETSEISISLLKAREDVEAILNEREAAITDS